MATNLDFPAFMHCRASWAACGVSERISILLSGGSLRVKLARHNEAHRFRGLSPYVHCGLGFTIWLRPDDFYEPPRASTTAPLFKRPSYQVPIYIYAFVVGISLEGYRTISTRQVCAALTFHTQRKK